MARGACNCGTVAFEVDADLSHVFVCHCSICRRNTGANGIAVVVVDNKSFRWTKGEGNIATWKKPGHDWQCWFCRICGSPLPGANDPARTFIPAGLIAEGGDKLRVAHHILWTRKPSGTKSAMPANNTAKRFRVSAAALALALVATGHARDCDVTRAEQAAVASVAAGGTLELADGRRARLASIQVPHADWPLAEEARARLATLVEGKTVELGYADRGIDRHGDLLAYVFVGDAWLQAQLIGEGFARVASRTDTSRCAAALLPREAAAREAKRGIWANAFFRVRKADEANADIGTFQIVEGKIVSARIGRERTYLNFGADYRTDFTVTIAARDQRRLAKEGIDPASWNGKTVRVRGWLALLNGPEIELTHAAQIEVLD